MLHPISDIAKKICNNVILLLSKTFSCIPIINKHTFDFSFHNKFFNNFKITSDLHSPL